MYRTWQERLSETEKRKKEELDKLTVNSHTHNTPTDSAQYSLCAVQCIHVGVLKIRRVHHIFTESWCSEGGQ